MAKAQDKVAKTSVHAPLAKALTVDGRAVFAGTGGRAFDPRRPVIVMVHGAGMDHTVWMSLARGMASAGYAVLAPDLPGHGRSDGPVLETVEAMAAWVVRLLDAAGVKDAALIGHSMGGAIAIEAAARQPERITRVVLMGTAAAIPVNPALLALARDDAAAAYQTMTAWGHGADVRLGGNVTPGLWQAGATRALFARNAAGVLASDLAACSAWTTGVVAAEKIACPALVVAAAGDVMTPAKTGKALAAAIKGAKMVVLPGVGHSMLAETPNACLDTVANFFRA
jgi:pimeloyl-ACP methyl ester carboxylesterase